jgi:ferredoxin
MIMVGATAVGICSTALLKGLQVFDQIAADLKIFLEQKGIKDIRQLRSLTHERIRERKMLFGLTAVVDPQRCNNCGLCLRSCFKQAISKGEEIVVIDNLLCEGCGLCVSICNRDALKLRSVVES